MDQSFDSLTDRELDVLKLVEAGLSQTEIAAILAISMPTVKRHLANIYHKISTTSRRQSDRQTPSR
ncbi:MAG TPA: helix-turn-helix transcriptional regulator [Chloroflexota bacterium]|jgi:LuxR family maltose regulon positive regulatory protein|nr:helix-turn-helix transcriptional regulator [Chloroflexota bacterium]